MTTFEILAVVMLTVNVLCSQVAHVRQNYPSSRRWRLYLFVSGFAVGAYGLVALLEQVPLDLESTTLVVLLGVVGGVVFGFLTPDRLERTLSRQDGASGNRTKLK